MSTVEILDTVTGAYYIIPTSQVQDISFELMEMDHGEVDVLIRVSNAARTYSICLGRYPNKAMAEDERTDVQGALTRTFMDETYLELKDEDGHPFFWIQFGEDI